MHDIRAIRDDPEGFTAACARRGVAVDTGAILALDTEWRQVVTANQEAQERRNALAREIGETKRTGGDTADLEAEATALKSRMADSESDAARLQSERDALIAVLPNLADADVPDGQDESANRLHRAWGEIPSFSYEAQEHWALGESLGTMDFTRATLLSGSRFTVLHGAMARLHRALASFMLDLHTTEHGYRETGVPHLVLERVLFGAGQLPKFGDDVFRTTTDHWLIPTSEGPLAALYADDTLDQSSLPLRLTAHTACFRSEAGAAGRDTRGMLRQHEFEKVEMVSLTAEEDSERELERMLSCAEAVLQKLELPYRVQVLCCGDMGFSAAKTYDLEVWLPGQKNYREISSCSNCRGFQARRLGMRYRAAQGGRKFVHSLNGSGVAVGRALVAVLENYQQEKGEVAVPEVLRPYMGGVEKLTRELVV